MTHAQQDMIGTTGSDPGWPRPGHLALVFLLYLGLAAAVTYPLAIEANDHAFGLQEFWVPFDESAAHEELFLSLLHTPCDATLPIDLPDVRVFTRSKMPEVP